MSLMSQHPDGMNVPTSGHWIRYITTIAVCEYHGAAKLLQCDFIHHGIMLCDQKCLRPIKSEFKTF